MIHPVFKYLLQIIDDGFQSESDDSSHWKMFCRQIHVSRDEQGNLMFKNGKGYGDITRRRWTKNALNFLERFTYHSVSSPLSSYAGIWKEAKQLASDLSVSLSNTIWNNCIVLAILADHWKKYRLNPKTFCLIGDGYGFLGTMISRLFPGRIYCVDLPKILLLQAHTHLAANPGKKFGVVTSADRNPADVHFVIPQEIENIQSEIDCAINVSSMQEMKVDSIEKYFSFLRRHSHPSSHFYCANRFKTRLPGGEVTEFYEYPWRSEDQIFMDGPCPYLTHFLSFRRAKNAYGEPTKGPSLWGWRIPFINYFDGVSMHRLVHLQP